MTLLFLVRHGDNESLRKGILPGQVPGIPLNDAGRDQAKNIARALNPLPICAVYSSPLERAVETAAPLARKKGLEVQIVPGLSDPDTGEWTGISLKSAHRLKGLWQVIQTTPSHFRFPGGESFNEVQMRVISALEDISHSHPGKKMVGVFFHADPIKLTLAHYLGIPLDGFQKLVIFPGSVSILNLDRKGAHLIAMNLVPPFSLPSLK